MSKIIVVTIDNSITIQDLERDSLQQLQGIVGGHIDVVHARNLPKPLCMVVNDSGIIDNLPMSTIGTLLYTAYIAGTAVIMKTGYNEDGEPDIIGLSDVQAKEIAEALKRLLNKFFEIGKDL